MLWRENRHREKAFPRAYNKGIRDGIPNPII